MGGIAVKNFRNGPDPRVAEVLGEQGPYGPQRSRTEPGTSHAARNTASPYAPSSHGQTVP